MAHLAVLKLITQESETMFKYSPTIKLAFLIAFGNWIAQTRDGRTAH